MNLRENIIGLAFANDRIEKIKNPYENHSLLTQLIRESLIEGGLGKKDPEAPLKDIIKPDSTVLLKPNWVLHLNLSGLGMECMVTHPNFILAVLQEVLATEPKKVLIGDAPIQKTIFSDLVSDKFINDIKNKANNCPVEIEDFRRDIWKESNGKIDTISEARDINEFIEFDLAVESLLEEISHQSHLFRNTKYDPSILVKKHMKGRHQYLLYRKAFEADVIINLPKLKTHRKAGITGAIKNLVGINGSKAYLPHHRAGGHLLGGDCYPGLAPLKRVAEFFLDKSNKNIKNKLYYFWLNTYRGTMLINRILKGNPEIEGGWYGNDTVWRMVLDLNRILLYGRTDGSLSQEPIRTIYSLTDAIIAGEGFGPLEPEPIKLGAVTFACSSAFADVCHAALMHFNWKKINLIKNAFNNLSYRLTTESPEKMVVNCNGEKLSYHETAEKYGRPFKPSKGWINHIEL